MAKIHNLGLPRIGSKRELKFALESYWQGNSSKDDLYSVGREIKQNNEHLQQPLDLVTAGDFSFYDHVLDTSFLVGNIPKRAQQENSDTLDDYFRVARGKANNTTCCGNSAGEMTKWFDTNYHYIVPEITSDIKFSLHAEKLIQQIRETQQQGFNTKPVILGPITYLWLCKAKDDTDPLLLLDQLLPVYQALLTVLEKMGITWLQIDEPALVTELGREWQLAYKYAYQTLASDNIKILLATYFGSLKENLPLISQLPVAGVHIDAINAKEEVSLLQAKLKDTQVLSIGIINGRNIWKTNLNKALDFLEPIAKELGDRLWVAPSCSLLHVPVDLDSESELSKEITPWLAFAKQKLIELKVLGDALNHGRDKVAVQLAENAQCLKSREQSIFVNDQELNKKINAITESLLTRKSAYQQRIKAQSEWLSLPAFPTTTIGSFPQTADIRKTRQQYRQGTISEAEYVTKMKSEISDCIKRQETLGLDVLVHGEAERNDMVEYFGEHLSGFTFSRFGWVQSYGSRCVKPPIIFGDVTRPKAITLDWTKFAQSITDKPVKGMLTGPVTILNWSFVRDDQPRAITCQQIALAIREEVLDLEAADIGIIQIDEAALREGLPLRQKDWHEYLDWAIDAFKLTANGVSDKTQIHTHMCYSDFNDIIASIADMDADVITIETSRSDMVLLNAFDKFAYPNEIGPGVYDIHSPNIPSVENIVELINKASQRIPAERLWINPDCGLKTRQWQEVTPALENMVAAAKELRQQAKLN